MVGAIEIALAVIKKADHFSRLDRWMFWLIIAVFAVTAILLVIRCYVGGRWRLGFPIHAPSKALHPGSDPDAPGSKEDSAAAEARKKYAPLSVAFSVFLLIWVLLLVAYQPAESTAKCPAAVPCGQPPAPSTAKLQVSPLKTVPLFDPHESNLYFFPASDKRNVVKGHSALPELEAVLFGAQAGDTLLLLGSADCTTFQKGGNAGLAQDRATTIMRELKSGADKRGVDIEATALKQHSACKDTQEMRAVFPVLIHPASAGP